VDRLEEIEAELERLNRRIHQCDSFEANPAELLDGYAALLDRWNSAKLWPEPGEESDGPSELP